MKNIFSIVVFIALSIFFFSCDKIDNPIIEQGDYRSDLYGEPPTFPNIETPIQRILLEDFTGHDCGNCPTAHGIATTIVNNNPGKVDVIAVHAGTLAQPYPPQYPANWVTPEGTYYLLTQVGVDEMPKGRINRIPDAHVAFSPSLWVNKTNAALNETPAVQLQISTSFSQENKHLNVHVNHQWFQGLSGNYRLVIMVLESHIIAPQLWYNHTPEYVEEYEHNHMLRTTLTGATGRVVTENPTAGLKKTNSYTMNWNENWNVENCEVVAFITEGENGRILNSVSKVIVE